jgi:hypothetical protein
MMMLSTSGGVEYLNDDAEYSGGVLMAGPDEEDDVDG